jgi:hypothetical protein
VGVGAGGVGMLVAVGFVRVCVLTAGWVRIGLQPLIGNSSVEINKAVKRFCRILSVSGGAAHSKNANSSQFIDRY